MAFTPDTDCLLEQISVPNSVVLVKVGAANEINVLVVNETYNIQIDKNTYLGNSEISKSIKSLKVKKVSVTNRDYEWRLSMDTMNNCAEVMC